MSGLEGPASMTRMVGLEGVDARRLARRRPDVPPGVIINYWLIGGLEGVLTSYYDEICGVFHGGMSVLLKVSELGGPGAPFKGR